MSPPFKPAATVRAVGEQRGRERRGAEHEGGPETEDAGRDEGSLHRGSRTVAAAIGFPRPCPLDRASCAAGDAAGAAVTGAAVTTGAAVGVGGYAKKLLP